MKAKLIGKRYGHLNKSLGYQDGHLLRVHITEHRLIFLLFHGYIPEEIDHKDRDKSNNRIENLREVTRTQNNLNHNLRVDNKTGVKGCYWHKKNKKWVSRIKINGKMKSLGSFKTLHEAKVAREIAEKDLF